MYMAKVNPNARGPNAISISHLLASGSRWVREGSCWVRGALHWVWGYAGGREAFLISFFFVLEKSLHNSVFFPVIEVIRK